MSVDPNKVKSVFLKAVDVCEPGNWTEFLEEACEGDNELRRRVEVLLGAHLGEDSLFDEEAGPSPTIESPITEKPGTQIGPYKLLQQIGEGGMGVVYLAEQKEPVKRRVALKIIKPGMDTRQVVARFEAERQALAMMDHPNIAKVLDAGATESGRPYFVMELVNGLPVTKYCDEQHLTPKERLELFVPICQAIQHAHQKGIIHRDLKPSNILVALYDGQPVPKIIDFGVAKATSQTLTDKTVFTQLGQVVGTLEYMSPEQAERNQLDIDTRSDIYSLGVVLYELLTGETPFDRERLRSAAFEEMLRIIREEEPCKPSTKVSSSQSLPSIAANRHIEPARLSSMIRGELDWIVMKALEKDRSRRYESAGRFAEDIQHHLNDEPVVACPPSTTYRFRKFARRNQTRLVVAGVLGLAVLVAVSALGWAIRDRTARQQEAARAKATSQERITSQVELILTDVSRLAEAREWPQALAVAQRAGAIISAGGVNERMTTRVREILVDLQLVEQLEDARLLAAQFVDGEWNHIGADRAYGRAFSDAGMTIEGASVAAATEQLRSHQQILGELVIGLTEWAFARRKTEIETEDASWRKLIELANQIDPAPWRQMYFGTLTPSEKDLADLRAMAESTNVQTLLPFEIVSLAKMLTVHVAPDEAVKLLARAQSQYPSDFWMNFELANNLRESTPQRLEDAVTFYRVALALRPGTVVVLNNLGNTLQDQGKLEEASQCYRKAIESDPKCADAYNNLGVALKKQGRRKEAVQYFQEAVALKPNWAVVHNNLGSAFHELNQLDAAVDCYLTATKHAPKYAPAYNNLGNLRKDQGKLDEAIRYYEKAVEFDPKRGMFLVNLGLALYRHGDSEKACECWRKAIRCNPNDAGAHYNLGIALYGQGQPEQAIQSWQAAIAADSTYAAAYNCLGVALNGLGRVDEAIKYLTRASELAPDDVKAHFNLGLALYGQNQLDKAIAQWRIAIEINPGLAAAHYYLGKALQDLGRVKESVEYYRKAIEHDETNPLPYTDLARLLATTADDRFRNTAEAFDLARQAAELEPASQEVLDTLSTVAYRAGDWETALEIRERIRHQHGGGAPGDWFWLSMIYSKVNNPTEAQLWFNKAVEQLGQREPTESTDEGLEGLREEAQQLLKTPVMSESHKNEDEE